ncbi:MAG: DNA internalization-related competence protein ComEC/Rec2 [Myxococcales bacterium]|nr:DNA internalization-related competence protein ComEC/Rec2 [Myxococcales bacterium]
MRVDPLLAVALALAAGPLAVVAPGPSALGFLGVFALSFGRFRPGVLALAVAALLAGAFNAHFALERWRGAWLDARAAVNEPLRCAATATVRSSPTRRGDAMSFIAELDALECEGQAKAAQVARVYGGAADLRRGDRLEVVAQLAPIQLFRNKELPDPAPGAARQGVTLSGMLLSAERVQRRTTLASLIDGARNHARAAIDRSFAPAAAPLARALVLGENDLEPEDDRAFRLSGLSHLLAVSGTHLVFAVAALVRALAAILVRLEALAARVEAARLAAAAGVPIALIYADFAGGSGSAWRAAWMLAFAYFVRAAGRHARPERTLGASLIGGTLVDPLLPFDVSFLLSAGATVGLIVLGQPFNRRVERLTWAPCRLVVGSIGTTLSAMIPCAPLLALLAPEQTLAGVLANGFAAPIGEAIALPLCLIHPLVSGVPGLGRGIALAASGALLWVRGVAHAGASARWLAFAVPPPNAWHFAVLAVALLGMWLRPPRFTWLLGGAFALAMVELAAIRAGHPTGRLRVSVLDVGQGDSLLVDLPDGSLMLVDGGGFVGSPVDPGKSVIAPLLRVRRRRRVDVVVLSHPHPDHFGGLASALERVEVGELWDTGQGEREGAGPVYRQLLAGLRSRGVSVLRPAELCGESRAFGAALVRVLAPCPDFVPGRGQNDNSLVVSLALGAHRALLLGDAEREEEEELVARFGRGLRADLLKLGHHGSRTSSSASLLGAVGPSYAAISCGVRNRFGHPHAQTLEAVAARSIHTLRTDLHGGLSWWTDGAVMRVEVSELIHRR